MGCATCNHCSSVDVRSGKYFVFCDHDNKWKEIKEPVKDLYGPCLYDTSGVDVSDSGTRQLTHEERIYSLIMYLKYDYCDDRINNYYYREYLTLLRDVTKDFLTKAKLDMMLYEIHDKRD